MAVLFRLVIFAFSIIFVPSWPGRTSLSRPGSGSAGVHAINALDVGYLPEEDGRDLVARNRATSMRSIFAPFRHPLNMTLDTEIVSSFDTTDRNDQMKLVYPGKRRRISCSPSPTCWTTAKTSPAPSSSPATLGEPLRM
ncbi:hypothetical protein BV898_12418 [Hypsibius exemplaris]|uniref:Uncharacterized protein n=1 Tax=Hypsibius exemplaris TaxID=2072580 RepID=A0A1W0WDU3_HYPEX|nr:hypothetical protein BV898_12418 [Hypsibius exemplaris]